jgi:hypothetical protein
MTDSPLRVSTIPRELPGRWKLKSRKDVDYGSTTASKLFSPATLAKQLYFGSVRTCPVHLYLSLLSSREPLIHSWWWSRGIQIFAVLVHIIFRIDVQSTAILSGCDEFLRKSFVFVQLSSVLHRIDPIEHVSSHRKRIL